MHGEKSLLRDSLVPFYSHTLLVSSLDECYNWQLNCMLHYSYCAVGICGRLFEGETYSLWTSHELGVTPQEQLENYILLTVYQRTDIKCAIMKPLEREKLLSI